MLKISHIAAVLVAYLCGVAMLRLRVHSCGCDDLTGLNNLGFKIVENSYLAAVLVAYL